MSTVIYAKQLRAAFLAGAANINANKDYINELNVFPVPDGDTGTNMSLTILSAAKEVDQLPEDPDMKALCKAISSGSLKGARGNSGVILSQLLRGLTKGIKANTEITTAVLAESFGMAVESAYKAVMKPKEGTILTVAKGIADKAAEIALDVEEIEEFAEQVVAYGNEVLDQTPEMLPVLKEAGVVDSGGKGLMTVLEGAVASLKNEDVAALTFDEAPVQNNSGAQGWKAPTPKSGTGSSFETDIKYGYCTEFIILLNREFTDKDEKELKEFLLSIGDSLVVVADDEIVKIHVHTNHPGQAFEKGLTYGELSRMKVDNMREEHREVLLNSEQAEQPQEAPQKEEPRKPMGIVAVSIGDGMNEIFRGLGVDYLVEGGQTMNPSTEDVLGAISHVNADTVFVFPNNKNIVMAANQARDLIEDKQIIVIPTTTVPQGITAVISFNPEGTPEENEEAFLEAKDAVATGQVTYAVRDTVINGIEVHMDDIMGMDDDGIKTVGNDINETTCNLIKEMVTEDSELISIYSGQDVTDKDSQKLLKSIEEAFPSCDVELNFGGQPVYYYIVSVE